MSNTRYDEHEFMEVQVHKIQVDKWTQGERQLSDPGEQYIFDWIYRNAKQFRDSWQIALCKDCSYVRECGYYSLSACDKFYGRDHTNEENFVS